MSSNPIGIPEVEEQHRDRDRTESNDSDSSSMMLNLTERKRRQRPVGQPAAANLNNMVAPSSQTLPTWNHLSYISKFANSFGNLSNI